MHSRADKARRAVGQEPTADGAVRRRTARERELMRQAGQVVAQTLTEISALVTPGVTTGELDRAAEILIRKLGAEPSFKGYHGYPATICTSVNDQIVHGIPGALRLAEGDIISIDCGAIWEGYQADAAVTVGVGAIGPAAQRLIDATLQALAAGIAAARANGHIGDISQAIEETAAAAGMQVVREYGGHGIGQQMHEPPRIPNWGRAGRGLRLGAGMMLALEPMLTLGESSSRVLADDWTVVTRDGGLAAHFEHTVAVTEDGVQILTRANQL